VHAHRAAAANDVLLALRALAASVPGEALRVEALCHGACIALLLLRLLAILVWIGITTPPVRAARCS
jgi:hypothetical protein